MSKLAIIGAGFSGLSAAAYLSLAGHEVHVFEKNSTAGGRARQLITDNGYVFDMGPSWYWMPDVFERFFNDFGYHTADMYELLLLDPSFEVVFSQNETIKIPASFTALCQLFETIEQGGAAKLKRFMQDAGYKYKIGMEKMVYMPGLSLGELIQPDLVKDVFRLNVFTPLSRHVRRYFSDSRLIALMEFPVLFLGAMPQQIPALYSLMNYAGLKLGTWYPKGGFGSVVDAMKEVAINKGGQFHFNASVQEIIVEGKRAKSIATEKGEQLFDGVIAAADYHYVENNLLPPGCSNYSSAYWEKKTLAPSCLIYYIGINKKISGLQHHTLFFDEDLLEHSREIYLHPKWPTKPLFYICCPSKTDDTVAPMGHENLFMLMPIAPALKDDDETREKYFRIMLKRLEQHTGETNLELNIDFKKSYCVTDFITDYHSYKGNAYGLANTLRQTANLKPSLRNKKLVNLFYAGQLTVPGPGVPPSLISGKLAATQLIKHLEKVHHEAII